jgi:hypothetical protein
LPTADNALESGDVSGQDLRDIGLIRARCHKLILASASKTGIGMRRLHYFRSAPLKKNATGSIFALSYQMQNRNRNKEAVMLFLFLSVGAVSLFSFIAVAVWSDARRKEREAYYKNETLKKIAESGAGGGAALEFLHEQEKIAERRRRGGLRLGGLISGAVGIAAMIQLRAMAHDPITGVPEGVYLGGLMPLLVGIVLLLYSYVLAPKE